MKKLNVYQLDSLDHLIQPREFSDLDEQSPALDLMTDFRLHQPHTINADVSAVGVARLMSMEGVSAKLVVNQRHEFVGLLTAERLSEQHILAAQTRLGAERRELTAADMMLPRASIPALDYEALREARVQDLVSALRDAGEAHCLVLDRTQHHIRGVISIEDVAERLHREIAVKSKPSIAGALCG